MKNPQSSPDLELNEKQRPHYISFFGFKINIFSQFSEFIKEYGVVGLAIGIVIGSAVTKFVNSFVENIVSPIIGQLLGIYTLSSWELGPIKIGTFLSSLIEFIIVLTIIFFSVKYVLRFFKLVEDKKEEVKNKENK